MLFPGTRRRAFIVLTAVLSISLISASGIVAQVDTLPAASEEEQGPPRVRITLGDDRVVVLEMIPDEAPIAVERFLELVRDEFYNGLRFHRVESYLVQAGKRDHDYPPIEGEMFGQTLMHEEGMVGMARYTNSYDSATTQFYIMKEHHAVFNCEYTLFARVVEGMDIVHNIEKNDKIENMEIID